MQVHGAQPSCEQCRVCLHPDGCGEALIFEAEGNRGKDMDERSREGGNDAHRGSPHRPVSRLGMAAAVPRCSPGGAVCWWQARSGDRPAERPRVGRQRAGLQREGAVSRAGRMRLAVIDRAPTLEAGGPNASTGARRLAQGEEPAESGPAARGVCGHDIGADWPARRRQAAAEHRHADYVPLHLRLVIRARGSARQLCGVAVLARAGPGVHIVGRAPKTVQELFGYASRRPVLASGAGMA